MRGAKERLTVAHHEFAYPRTLKFSAPARTTAQVTTTSARATPRGPALSVQHHNATPPPTRSNASRGQTPQTNRSGENGQTRTIPRYSATKPSVTVARRASAKAPA